MPRLQAHEGFEGHAATTHRTTVGSSVPSRVFRAILQDEPIGHEDLANALAWGFVGLGILLRIIRLTLNHPVWGDESYLVANLVTRGFLGLTRPLDFAQVAPVSFLWIEKALLGVLGTSEVALRVFPTACGIGALLLFRRLCGRLLSGPAIPLAVAFLAVAFYPIRHGNEAKPYASDLLVAVSLLSIGIGWLRKPDDLRRVWLFAWVAPVSILLSMPAVFVIGAVGLPWLRRAWLRNDRRTWKAILTVGATCLSSLIVSMALIHRTRPDPATMDSLLRDWVHAGAFAPANPIGWIVWFARNHTSQMFAYPIGGGNGASILTTLCFVSGVVGLWQAGRRELLAVLLLPFVLGMMASIVGPYPYGASARTMQYVAPSICLLSGLGLVDLIRFRPGPLRSRRGVALALGTMAMIGLASLWLDTARPYKTVYERNARDFARWFWTDLGRDGEIACLHTDFGLTFNRRHWQLERTAAYLADQAIYSERHSRRRSIRHEAVTAAHPLRCVLFNEHPTDHPEFIEWLTAMRAQYDLAAIRRFPVNRGAVSPKFNYEDFYIVYEFVPKGDPTRSQDWVDVAVADPASRR